MSRLPLRPLLLVVLSFVLLSLVGCGPEPDAVELDPTWKPGEVSRYTIVADDGTVVGAAAWEVQRKDDQWVLVHSDGKGNTTGEMVLDDKLRPVRGWRVKGGLRAETVYKPEEVVVTRVGEDGEKKIETMVRPEGAVDNEQGLQSFRFLPFEPGFSTTFQNVSAAGGAVPFTVEVVGEQSVEVPAGQFDTWHGKLSFGSIQHEVWYGKHEPHYLVKYRNPTVGKTFQLRSYREAEGAPDQGQVAPPPAAEPGSQPISWSLVAVMGLLQVPLMSLLPIVLGLIFSRKLKVGWKLWAAGAAAFIASQVVHLPLNWAIGLLGPPRGAGLLPLPFMAVVAGLSAGVCEEVARYVALGVVLRKIRHSWNEALQFGAGHGGVESMILGALVGINVVAMVVIEYSPGSLGLEGEVLSQTLAASDSFWRTPWHASLAGGIERVFAITAHIGMSVMVMRAIATRKLAWLFAAIGAHAVLDAVAVVSSARLGIWWTEALIAAMALAFLALTLRLRKAPWPEGPIEPSNQQPEPSSAAGE